MTLEEEKWVGSNQRADCSVYHYNNTTQNEKRQMDHLQMKDYNKREW